MKLLLVQTYLPSQIQVLRSLSRSRGLSAIIRVAAVEILEILDLGPDFSLPSILGWRQRSISIPTSSAPPQLPCPINPAPIPSVEARPTRSRAAPRR